MGQHILFNDINPFVRWVHISNSQYLSVSAIPYENRLFYCIKGKGKIVIEGKEYIIERDTAIFWSSGKEYICIPDNDNPFSFLAINFDFTDISKHKSLPLPPFVGRKKDFNGLEQVIIDDFPILSDVIVVKNAILLKKKFEKILIEFNCREYLYDKICSSLIAEILSEMIRQSLGLNVIKIDGRINSILDYLNNNFSLPITNKMVGDLFGYHPNYVSNLFQKQLGITLHQYILQIRINKAKNYLLETDMSISEIAEICGFGNNQNFAKKFKQFVHCSPNKYRINVKGSDNK